MIAGLKQRVAELLRTLANSEQDRRVVQERFDNTRSDADLLCFIHFKHDSFIQSFTFNSRLKAHAIEYNRKNT